MPLTPDVQAKREGKITASFLPALMAGYDDDIFTKWLELIGDPSWQPKPINWPMAWGSYGEPFILDWHERETQMEIARRGEFVQHPKLDYVGCTLDGYRFFDDCVLDAKVCQAWTPIDEIVAFYTPQLLVQKACVGCLRCALLLVHGSSEPAEYEIVPDPKYEATMWKRIDQFWNCVRDLVQPVTFPRVVPPEQWITIDLDRDGAQFNWAQSMQECLADWARTKDNADIFEVAAKEVKKILPDDCGTLKWSGLIVKRNRANAISIKRAKQ